MQGACCQRRTPPPLLLLLLASQAAGQAGAWHQVGYQVTPWVCPWLQLRMIGRRLLRQQLLLLGWPAVQPWLGGAACLMPR
jgi:hypothetical protein